jgi:hypothetical protein
VIARVSLVALLFVAPAVQAARIAVHPLEAEEFSVEQRKQLQGMFEVMVARVANVRRAGGTRVEEALARPEGKACETHDACLRFLAQSTESLYGVYARLRPDPLGSELRVSARVVRVDGEVVRKVALSAAILEGSDVTQTARTLLSTLVGSLELGALADTLPVDSAGESAPPLVSSTPEPPGKGLSPRQTFGFGLFGLGVATLAAGGVVLGMASSEGQGLTPDSRGVVPLAQASRAASTARHTQVATVLLPAGALVTLTGGLLGFWPESAPVKVAVDLGSTGAGLRVATTFP